MICSETQLQETHFWSSQISLRMSEQKSKTCALQQNVKLDG